MLYEANPIAFLIEQAGGRASNGRTRLMEQTPQSLHERCSFMFGSRAEVALIERYHQDDHYLYDSPLFNQRGLFAKAA